MEMGSGIEHPHASYDRRRDDVNTSTDRTGVLQAAADQMNIMPGAPQAVESAKSQKQFIIKKQQGRSKQRAHSKKASLVKAYLPNLMPKNGGGGGEMTLVTPTNVA